MMKKDLLICVCKNEKCKYEFVTNVHNLHCPLCGNQDIVAKSTKGIIYEEEDLVDESKDKNIIDYSNGLFFRQGSKELEVAINVLKWLNIDVFRSNVYQAVLNEETACQFDVFADELGIEVSSSKYNKMLLQLQDAISEYNNVFSDFEQTIYDAVRDEYQHIKSTEDNE